MTYDWTLLGEEKKIFSNEEKLKLYRAILQAEQDSQESNHPLMTLSSELITNLVFMLFHDIQNSKDKILLVEALQCLSYVFSGLWMNDDKLGEESFESTIKSSLSEQLIEQSKPFIKSLITLIFHEENSIRSLVYFFLSKQDIPTFVQGSLSEIFAHIEQDIHSRFPTLTDDIIAIEERSLYIQFILNAILKLFQQHPQETMNSLSTTLVHWLIDLILVFIPSIPIKPNAIKSLYPHLSQEIYKSRDILIKLFKNFPIEYYFQFLPQIIQRTNVFYTKLLAYIKILKPLSISLVSSDSSESSHSNTNNSLKAISQYNSADLKFCGDTWMIWLNFLSSLSCSLGDNLYDNLISLDNLQMITQSTLKQRKIYLMTLLVPNSDTGIIMKPYQVMFLRSKEITSHWLYHLTQMIFKFDNWNQPSSLLKLLIRCIYLLDSSGPLHSSNINNTNTNHNSYSISNLKHTNNYEIEDFTCCQIKLYEIKQLLYIFALRIESTDIFKTNIKSPGVKPKANQSNHSPATSTEPTTTIDTLNLDTILHFSAVESIPLTGLQNFQKKSIYQSHELTLTYIDYLYSLKHFSYPLPNSITLNITHSSDGFLPQLYHIIKSKSTFSTNILTLFSPEKLFPWYSKGLFALKEIFLKKNFDLTSPPLLIKKVQNTSSSNSLIHNNTQLDSIENIQDLMLSWANSLDNFLLLFEEMPKIQYSSQWIVSNYEYHISLWQGYLVLFTYHLFNNARIQPENQPPLSKPNEYPHPSSQPFNSSITDFYNFSNSQVISQSTAANHINATKYFYPEDGPIYQSTQLESLITQLDPHNQSSKPSFPLLDESVHNKEDNVQVVLCSTYLPAIDTAISLTGLILQMFNKLMFSYMQCPDPFFLEQTWNFTQLLLESCWWFIHRISGFGIVIDVDGEQFDRVFKDQIHELEELLHPFKLHLLSRDISSLLMGISLALVFVRKKIIPASEVQISQTPLFKAIQYSLNSLTESDALLSLFKLFPIYIAQFDQNIHQTCQFFIPSHILPDHTLISPSNQLIAFFIRTTFLKLSRMEMPSLSEQNSPNLLDNIIQGLKPMLLLSFELIQRCDLISVNILFQQEQSMSQFLQLLSIWLHLEKICSVTSSTTKTTTSSTSPTTSSSSTSFLMLKPECELSFQICTKEPFHINETTVNYLSSLYLLLSQISNSYYFDVLNKGEDGNSLSYAQKDFVSYCFLLIIQHILIISSWMTTITSLTPENMKETYQQTLKVWLFRLGCLYVKYLTNISFFQQCFAEFLYKTKYSFAFDTIYHMILLDNLLFVIQIILYDSLSETFQLSIHPSQIEESQLIMLQLSSVDDNLFVEERILLFQAIGWTVEKYTKISNDLINKRKEMLQLHQTIQEKQQLQQQTTSLHINNNPPILNNNNESVYDRLIQRESSVISVYDVDEHDKALAKNNSNNNNNTSHLQSIPTREVIELNDNNDDDDDDRTINNGDNSHPQDSHTILSTPLKSSKSQVNPENMDYDISLSNSFSKGLSPCLHADNPYFRNNVNHLKRKLDDLSPHENLLSGKRVLLASSELQSSSINLTTESIVLALPPPLPSSLPLKLDDDNSQVNSITPYQKKVRMVTDHLSELNLLWNLLLPTLEKNETNEINNSEDVTSRLYSCLKESQLFSINLLDLLNNPTSSNPNSNLYNPH